MGSNLPGNTRKTYRNTPVYSLGIEHNTSSLQYACRQCPQNHILTTHKPQEFKMSWPSGLKLIMVTYEHHNNSNRLHYHIRIGIRNGKSIQHSWNAHLPLTHLIISWPHNLNKIRITDHVIANTWINNQ